MGQDERGEARPHIASLLFEDFRRQPVEEPSSLELPARQAQESDSGDLSVGGLLRSASSPPAKKPRPDALPPAVVAGSEWDALPPTRFLLGQGDFSPVPGRRVELPDAGDEIFGFRLREELGAGAFARVFLADQLNLAARPVVVKVSGLDGHEPQTLAQMQHTHIVPIHSVHEDARTGVRAVCMPYLGGATLAGIVAAVFRMGGTPHSGNRLVRALHDVSSEVVSGQCSVVSEEHGPLALLEKLSYLQASAWVVARLAEGLDHAHRKGILHRDIKPSNVLVGADGQPMLLDFNLARDLRSDAACASLGGTVAYMAPEHLRALAFRTPALIQQVDQRSDIYALGMVLFEMLTGRRPFDHAASYTPLPALIEAMAVERGRTVPSLREHRPDAPWSLESIVRKCLAPNPDQRYQQAEHLAEDLRRFLDDRPLAHAPELSRVERAQKWLRRHPTLTSSTFVGTVIGVFLVAAVCVLFGMSGKLAVWGAAHARELRRKHEEGAVQAVCLVSTTTPLQDHLVQGQKVCEETLGIYGVLDRDDWEANPDWQRLAPKERRQAAEATRELLLLLARARVHTAGKDRGVIEGALGLLDKAEAIRGLDPSPALWHERAHYLELLGDEARAAEARTQASRVEPGTARDCYLLATAYLRKNRADAYALGLLDKAVHLDPRHYWSCVQRGICHLGLGNYEKAAGDFGTCVGLWPEFAWGYYNRAVALDKAGKKVEALADYTAAVARDPKFVPALANRAMVYLELGRYTEALADFDWSLGIGPPHAILHLGRGQALEGLGRFEEADAAYALALSEPALDAEAARFRLAYGFAVTKRLPQAARKAFELVLWSHPGNPQALYGLAVLLVEQGQEPLAMQALNEALVGQPVFVEARRARAILLARQGRFEEADVEVSWCLGCEPQGGEGCYTAGCVAALRAAKLPAGTEAARQAANQALQRLREAFNRGVRPQRAKSDPDLAALRSRPEFRQLLQGR